jgi:hypothetical protein
LIESSSFPSWPLLQLKLLQATASTNGLKQHSKTISLPNTMSPPSFTTIKIQVMAVHQRQAMSGEFSGIESYSIPTHILLSKPETYVRPHVTQQVTVHDISGEEDRYTLDSHGFQIYPHESSEKDFQDDEQIKAHYYPETEQLLKDA